MDLSILRSQLVRDEGIRLSPYIDTTGHLTIGCGRKLDANPLTPAEFYAIGSDCRSGTITLDQAMILLNDDIQRTVSGLSGALPWFSDLDDVRQRVLINMAFNLGIHGLLGFTRMLYAASDRRYYVASRHMLASMWARQVGVRAHRLAAMMAFGTDR